MDLSIIVMDIDGFEAVNCELGRGAGDQLLCDLVRFFGEFLRDADVICRCRDDEFVILLPGADLAGASQVAEGLRGHVYSELLCEDLRSLSPTFSIGIAEMDYNLDKNIEVFVRRAREALSQAKKRGKDQVCIWFPPEEDLPGSDGEDRS
jgi:diguanylate cyclase (GGDEF)-like protein